MTIPLVLKSNRGNFVSCPGQRVAVKILENVPDNIEEIEEEYLILKDLSLHPNIPAFHGLFLRKGSTPEEDQLWFVMEVRLTPRGLSPGRVEPLSPRETGIAQSRLHHGSLRVVSRRLYRSHPNVQLYPAET